METLVDCSPTPSVIPMLDVLKLKRSSDEKFSTSTPKPDFTSNSLKRVFVTLFPSGIL